MALTVSDAGGVSRYTPPPVQREPAPVVPAPTNTPSGARPEPSYHPQMPPPGTPVGPDQGQGGASPYALPANQTLSDASSGTQAQPFDVTMSQLATAVYGTRGDPPPGWSAVTDQMLTDRGVTDPQAWREQYLGGGPETTAQEFKAEIYTDGDGNFVLSYRGTAEGADDWMNNFTQGTGFQTPDGDKFAGTAVDTAMAFEQVFGNNQNGESSNLAITGHSQGGGLASAGALATGIPAVTFDASGLHPNTLDRMGIDPQAARDMAEGGQIRAYSLSSDALTNAQDAWVTGLAAPDALGTQIVVEPAPQDVNNMFTNYGPIEDIPAAPVVNTAVELARNPLTGMFLPGGLLTVAAGNLAYNAISHSPNALTTAMVDRQPWQAGYENPSSIGRDAQNLLPDIVKDDYARNTNDLISDVQQVASTQFAEGDFVEGTYNIVGDLAEGALNSTGDTIDGYADTLASTIDDNIDGWAGDALSTVVDGTGDLIEGGADLLGQGVETVTDGAGWVAQKATDGAAAVVDFFNPFN